MPGIRADQTLFDFRSQAIENPARIPGLCGPILGAVGH